MANHTKRRKIHCHKKSAVVLSGLLISLLLACPVLAGGGVDFFQNLAKDMLTAILGGTMNDNALTVFSDVPWHLSQASGGWAVASYIMSNVIKPVASALVGICFTIRMVQVSAHLETMTVEKYLSVFTQMAFCLFLVGYSDTLLTTIINAGVSLAVRVQNGAISLLSQPTDALLAQMMPDFENSSGGFLGIDIFTKEFWSSALMVVRLFLPYLAYKIVSILIKVIAYGVLIELIVRSALFPLFAGDLMLHGFEGRGFHALRAFVAASIQGAVIVLIAGIQNGLNYSALSGVVTGSGLGIPEIIGNIGLVLIYDFSAFALMLKAGQITKEAIGG